MIAPAYSLRDGNWIPAIGLGTYGLNDQTGIESIVSGIADGYRLIDTAYNYGNEDVVGEAVRRTDVDRSDLMITTKLPGRHHGFDETLASFEESRRRLDLDWVDLYLIHWPLPRIDKYIDTWRVMRSIGVSNFTADMLERLERETHVVPAVNQVELHPYFPQEELRAYHDEHDIRTECWSPLAKRSELLQENVITALAAEKAVSPAQVVLRWHVELEAVPIPKSADAARRRENLDVFSFTLLPEEVEAISALSRGRLWGADPDTHEEF